MTELIVIYSVGFVWGMWYLIRLFAWSAMGGKQKKPDFDDYLVALAMAACFAWFWPLLMLAIPVYRLTAKFSNGDALGTLFPPVKKAESKAERYEREAREAREENERLQKRIDELDRQLGLGPYSEKKGGLP